MVVGLPAGLLAGYFGGWFDSVASWVSSVLMALPAIIVLLVVLARVGRSTVAGHGGLRRADRSGGLPADPVLGDRRCATSSTSTPPGSPGSATAGSCAGTSSRWSSRRSSSRPPQLAGVAIGIQAGLEFLGLGSADQASWGVMLSDAFQNIYTAPLPAALARPGHRADRHRRSACWATPLRDALGAAAPRKPAGARRPDAVAAGPPGTATGETTAEVAVRPTRLLGRPRPARRLPAGRRRRSRSWSTDVSLTVHRGEILGLVGESGSGKSQTAFSDPRPAARRGAAASAGRASSFDGADLRRRCPPAGRCNRLRGRRIGYIPQEPMSQPGPVVHASASQLVEPDAPPPGLSRPRPRPRRCGCSPGSASPNPERVFAAYPHEISGGMAQRVLIAGAVSCDPDLLIADEPTTALDVTVQAEVLDLIRELQAERQHGRHPGHPQLRRRRRPLRPRGGHAGRPDRRDGAGAASSSRDPQHEYTRMLLASIARGHAAR